MFSSGSNNTDSIHCELCPHLCRIDSGGHGFCGVRGNIDGSLDLPYYGVISAFALDPVEKKPIYHFHPGSFSYSIGFFGCNLRCPFCQNYQISTTLPAARSKLTFPADIVSAALKVNADSISYTYSEPLIHAEFCLDTAAAAEESGLSNIIVTNGYMTEKAAESIFSVMHAANIDLKSFNPHYYEKVLKGGLYAVRRSIEAASALCHTEVTTLLVPGENDSEEELESLVSFLADLNPQPVLHLSRYFPRYKYRSPATPVNTLLKAGRIAREKLKYVYIGNLSPMETAEFSNNTVCSDCGNLLIDRESRHIKVINTSAETCDSCGSPLPYTA